MSPRLLAFLVIAITGCHDCHPQHTCLQPDGGTATLASSDECVVAGGNPALVDQDCTDEFEPNDELVMAAATRNHECSQTTKRGSLAGPADVDVYRTGTCNVGLLPYTTDKLKPWASITAEDPATLASVRLCIFPACGSGSTHIFTCDDPDGDHAPVRSDVGFEGCCRTGAGRIMAELDCSFFSAKIDTFVWVDGANQCLPYDVTYEIDNQ